MTKNFPMEIIDKNLLNLVSCIVGESVGYRGISTPMHNHKEIEILYITHGSIRYEFYNKETVFLEQGDIIFTNYMVPHETKICTPDSRVYVLQFSLFNFFKSSVLDSNKYLHAFINSQNSGWYVFKKEENAKMRECIENIYAEKLSVEKGYEIMILSNLYYIIGELFRKDIIKFSSDMKEKSFREMTKVLSFIDENYMNNITLKDVCSEANISPTHFCRIFKKVTGDTFVHYLNFKRSYQAEKLLRMTNKSITEIAYDVGFASGSYFDKIFKKYYKMSPMKYRDMMENE